LINTDPFHRYEKPEVKVLLDDLGEKTVKNLKRIVVVKKGF
jgi:hypothetical protein